MLFQVTFDKPQESCKLDVHPTCQLENEYMPILETVEECVKVPKELCSRHRTNPRRVKKPVLKKWCGRRDLLEAKLSDSFDAALRHQL